MGAWGTDIFQDDTACDIRDEYRDHIGNGLSGLEATAHILKSYANSLTSPDEAPVVWLALAATQWKLGRLDDETRERAMHVIESGSDLKRWTDNTKDLAARKTALERLRTQISSPPPPPRKIKRQAPTESHWKVGELVALKLLSGKLTVFRVIGHHADHGGQYPVCEFLDWTGDSIPAEDFLRTAPIKTGRPDHKLMITQWMLVGLNKKALTRMEDLNINLPPAQKQGRCSVIHWKYFDKFLKDWFLLE